MALEQTIVLSVADSEGLNPVDEEFDNQTRSDVKGEYISENHTSLVRDTLTTYCTRPKQTSAFYGVDKGAVKFSTDELVGTPQGTTTRAPGIIMVQASKPVGFSDASFSHLEQRIIAFIKAGKLREVVTRGMV